MPPADSDDPAEERAFTARMDAVASIARFVGEMCERHRLPASIALRSTLVLEELFTNTVQHGHRGDSDALVHIALRAQRGTLRLVYEDHAPAFDPVAAAAALPPPDAATLQRPVGGVGLMLTSGLGRNPRYARVDGRNRLELTIDALPNAAPG